MGGPSQSTLNTQNQLTQEQLQTSQQANQIASQEQQQMQTLEAPAINQYTALTSGNPQAIMSAISPSLTGVTQSKAANAEQIKEQLGPGAARDEALAQNVVNAGNQTASLQANAVSSSYDKLANIGAGLGSFSLQELGAGISAGSAASSANQVSINAAEQSKASTLGFLGTLAGAGTDLLSGGIGSFGSGSGSSSSGGSGVGAPVYTGPGGAVMY